MILLTNATVFTGDTWLNGASVRIEHGRIREVTNAPVYDFVRSSDVIDCEGDYLVPGLIDLQLYGGSQLFLNDQPTPATVRHIYETHARNGTTTLLPTIHSTSLDVMQQAIAAVQTVRAEMPLGVPGIHVEGPYFNPIKRGAHSAAYVRTPAEGELETLFATNADVILILTLAPEILTPEQFQKIVSLKHTNTRLSLGHSNATYRQATDAFNSGQVPLATHLYNAMRGFESREPGVVGAVFDHPTVRASIIADGYHCDPATIRIAHKLLNGSEDEPGRLFLISDALFASSPGQPGPRAEFSLGEFIVHHEPGESTPGESTPGESTPGESTPGESTPGESTPGRYVNNEGKLAGSALTLLDCVRVCVEKVGLSLTDALQMATVIPAEVVGLHDQIGRIRPGYAANVVRLTKSLAVQSVWRSGL
ncbi:N-acetylglucosamine-6-phosphate deacetylase [Spirosoma montaniterrae]|uniref:N-acetylglucosamine-6-phosphate deacetylase n=1 Tax=Spirosoma montaniterrae TaxID=1178516 RepID=A0A1P9WWH5_9BACT|nr:N-acetylglucosamine-6-phosphate deacetylase [Spirosoma montaniterrae]AQG79721.1 N-acetylglucosamine-6-phosphate deacetylase [Spirosoma montaniterrae]